MSFFSCVTPAPTTTSNHIKQFADHSESDVEIGGYLTSASSRQTGSSSTTLAGFLAHELSTVVTKNQI